MFYKLLPINDVVNGLVLNDGGNPQLLLVRNDDHRICGIYGNIKQWVMQMGLMFCVRDNH